MVLRVSQMRTKPSTAPAASTQRAVVLATPESRPRKFRAVRSAVSTAASGPRTVATTSPGARRSPSTRNQTTSMSDDTWAKASVAHELPASTPTARLAITPSATESSGTRAALTSPSGVRSSCRASTTASATASTGGSTKARSAPIPGLRWTAKCTNSPSGSAAPLDAGFPTGQASPERALDRVSRLPRLTSPARGPSEMISP